MAEHTMPPRAKVVMLHDMIGPFTSNNNLN